MKKTSWREKLGLILALLLVLFLVAIFRVIDGSAGNHQPIYLMSKDGEVINPIAGENADQPYSPYLTCGGCHDYETIVSGYHFQQGAENINDSFSKEHPWVLSNGMFGKF